jgi:hypothetical protein
MAVYCCGLQAAGCGGGRRAADSTSRSASDAGGGLTVTSRQQRIVVATAAYNQGKLVTLATKFYTKDFTSDELSKLPLQLTVYISRMCRDGRFKI